MAVFSIWYNRNFEPYFFTVDLSYLVQNTNNWDKSKCLFTESSIKPGRSDFKCLTLYLYVHIWSFLYCISYTHTFFCVTKNLFGMYCFRRKKNILHMRSLFENPRSILQMFATKSTPLMFVLIISHLRAATIPYHGLLLYHSENRSFLCSPRLRFFDERRCNSGSNKKKLRDQGLKL